MHGCNVGSAAERVLAGLPDAYASANLRARAAAAASSSSSPSSSSDDDDGRPFRGVCRGCVANDFSMDEFLGM